MFRMFLQAPRRQNLSRRRRRARRPPAAATPLLDAPSPLTSTPHTARVFSLIVPIAFASTRSLTNDGDPFDSVSPPLVGSARAATENASATRARHHPETPRAVARESVDANANGRENRRCVNRLVARARGGSRADAATGGENGARRGELCILPCAGKRAFEGRARGEGGAETRREGTGG